MPSDHLWGSPPSSPSGSACGPLVPMDELRWPIVRARADYRQSPFKESPGLALPSNRTASPSSHQTIFGACRQLQQKFSVSLFHFLVFSSCMISSSRCLPLTLGKCCWPEQITLWLHRKWVSHKDSSQDWFCVYSIMTTNKRILRDFMTKQHMVYLILLQHPLLFLTRDPSCGIF